LVIGLGGLTAVMISTNQHWIKMGA
jgi:hypothetical protein